ncbi:MAG: hypothetical protein ACO388_01835 [Saprospiraceae bacterium]|jgi:hypothetical protein
MEVWERDFEWLKIRHHIKDDLKREQLPDLNAVLFLIGIQELGRWRDSFTKEEKQDLMHVAVCTVLIPKGFYSFVGRDEEGWPHFERIRAIEKLTVAEQEQILIEGVIHYFKERENESIQ